MVGSLLLLSLFTDNKVLDDSPAKLLLEMAKIYAEAIGVQDKVYFVPEGADISLFLDEQCGNIASRVPTG